MLQNLLDLSLSPLNLVVRAAVVYLAILLLLRISGKKQVGQMGAVEFVTILLISNAVQNSMNGGDNSLIGGLLLALVLITISTIISFLTYKSRFFSHLFEGTPTLVIHRGKILHKPLRREMMSESELIILLRKQGINHFSEIETAVLEADGTLSVTRVSETFATTN